MEGAPPGRKGHASLRERLVALSNSAREQGARSQRLNQRMKMREMLVEHCEMEDGFERQARALCGELYEASNPGEFAFALLFALDRLPVDDNKSEARHDSAGDPDVECFDRSRFILFALEEVLLWIGNEEESGQSPKRVEQMIPALHQGIDSSLSRSVPKVLDLIADNFSKTGCVQILETIPHALRKFQAPAIRGSSIISLEDAETPFWCSNSAGEKFDASHLQAKLIHHLCSLDWKPSLTADILSILDEVKLTMAEVELIARKALYCCGEAEFQLVPSLTYQLLLLSRQGKGDIILNGIAKLFESMESKSWKESGHSESGSQVNKIPLLTMEGTVLLQINVIAKQKQESSLSFVRSLRERGFVPKPYLLGILLSLGRISQFEKQVFSLLEEMVLLSYTRQNLSNPCKSWLPHRKASAKDIECGFSDLVSRSCHWDIVLQSLVQLGTKLIGTGSAAVKDLNMSPLHDTKEWQNPHFKKALLGVNLIYDLFETHDAVRGEILKICQQEIMKSAPHAIFYIHLLGRLCLRCNKAVAEHSSLVKECLNCFLIISPSTAVHFLIATLPLISSIPDLKDHTILVLRKAMFSRDTNHRTLAIKCFMHMIMSETSSRGFESERFASCSQPSESQCHSRSSMDDIVQDLLGFLRRGMKQQYALRQALYNGFLKLASFQPKLVRNILEILLPHFADYYEQDRTLQPPLKVEKCSSALGSTFRPCEPLHDLIFCLQSTLQTYARLSDGGGRRESGSGLNGNGRQDAGTLLEKDFGDMVQRFLLSNLEDFGIDKVTDFDSKSCSGQINLHNCYVLLGCIEALMNSLSSQTQTQDLDGSCESAIKGLFTLFTMFERLQNLIDKGNKMSKRDKASNQSHGDTSASTTPAAFFIELTEKRVPKLSTDTLAFLLGVIHKGEFPLQENQSLQTQTVITQAPGVKLARSSSFHRFVLQSSQEILDAVRQRTEYQSKVILACNLHDGGGHQLRRDHVLKVEDQIDWHKMGLQLFLACETMVLASCNQSSFAVAPGRTKGLQEELLLLACKCIHNLLLLAVSPKCLQEMLPGLEATLQADNGFDGLGEDQVSLRELQAGTACYTRLCQMLSKLVKVECLREAEVISNSIFHICSLYPTQFGVSASKMAITCCRSTNGRHPGLGKALLKLALCFSASPHDTKLCLDLSDDIRWFIENTAGDAEFGKVYKIVSEKTITSLVQMTLLHCNEILDDIDWALDSLKRAQDESPMKRMSELLGILNQYCFLTLPMHSITDSLIKCLTKFYKNLGNMAKAWTTTIRKPDSGRSYKPSLSHIFVQLSDKSVRELTPTVYEFLLSLHPDNAEEKDRQSESALKKEFRSIPNLIYHIEECDRKLIALSNSSGVNVMKNAKRSTARDFKISISKKCKV